MSDFSKPKVQFPPLFISTYTQPFCGMEARAIGGINPASGAWPLALYVAYVPFQLPFPYLVRRIWWQNGSAAGGNTDVGVYTSGGTRVFSTGSTAGSGNSAPQFVTIADTLLHPGSYFFAMVHDSITTNQLQRGTTLSIVQQRAIGHLSQTLGSGPLPVTATFAASSQIVYPLCGISCLASGF